MESIKLLQKKSNDLREALSENESKIQEAYNVIFDDCSQLQKSIKDLENLDDNYMFDDNSWVSRWLRFDFKPFKDCIEYLKEYLSENYIGYDINNDCLTQSLGPEEIIINDDGVFQDGDCIIESKEYSNLLGLAILIEKHMERTGCYPCVFEADRYDNLTRITLPDVERGL